jgi:hypothetical protein
MPDKAKTGAQRPSVQGYPTTNPMSAGMGNAATGRKMRGAGARSAGEAAFDAASRKPMP